MKPHNSTHVESELPKQLEAMWRFALRLTNNPDDAADLIQKTCLRALEQRGHYIEQDRFRSWLFRIEHNIWRNEIRSRSTRRQVSLNAREHNGQVIDLLQYNSELPHADLPGEQLYFHQVCEAVESLPEAQRLVMILCSVEGRTYQETADILDIPIGTVMSRLARARLTIGQKMMNSHVTELPKDAQTLEDTP